MGMDIQGGEDLFSFLGMPDNVVHDDSSLSGPGPGFKVAHYIRESWNLK
jgi:hypothetical protein